MNGVIDPIPPEPAPTSRRQFISQLGAWSAVGMVLPACTGNLQPTRVESSPLPPEPPRLTRPPVPTTEPMVRVRLAATRTIVPGTLPEAIIESDDGWIQVQQVGSARRALVMQSPLRVAREGDRWTIRDRSGFSPEFERIDPIELASPEGAAHGLRVGEKHVSGSVVAVAVTRDVPEPDEAETSPVDTAAFDLINHVPMEQYLPGVLAGELYANWHPACFAAQAIAARSFATVECWYWAGRRHFDVTATASSQMYTGRTLLAVARNGAEETRGAILTWQHSVVPAYYSSCCGGVGASAIDEVSPNPVNDIPPLAARSGPNACTGATVYAWTIERPRHDVGRRLTAYGRANRFPALSLLGTPTSIAPSQTNPFGRPTRFAIIDDRGAEAPLPSMRLRRAVDYPVSGIAAAGTPLRSSFVEVRTRGNTLVFEGRGYGHGVGLCQHGAQSLAKRGMSAESIVAEFYPGAALTSAYV